MNKLEQLQEAVRSAYENWQTAVRTFDEADPHAENYDAAALEQDCTVAREAHDAACRNLERHTALEDAKRDLPVAPVQDDPEKPAARSLVVTETSLTYEKPRQRNAPTIFRDMAAAQFEGDSAARERIARHGKEMADVHNPRVGERALNITDGTGGEFVPPIYLQDQWIGLPRARRPFADLLNPIDLPAGTDTINIPKVNSGTTVAVQTDGGAVSSTDLTDTHVTAAVQTVAGQQDVSQQLVDLSAPGIDVVIWDDITRAYDTKIDSLALNGTVTNAKGALQVSGTNPVTFTSATPTVPLLYPKVADGIQRIHTSVFMPPSAVLMHPVRWAWILASLDSQNRPLVVPVGQPGFNALGLQERVAAESIVGTIQGVPIVVDASIPTNGGAGTNQDSILIARDDEVRLWESPSPRLRVFGEVLSGTLQVRFQLYNYYAIMCGRLPAAMSVISGTGLVAPTF